MLLIQIREASQALLLAELRRINVDGRHRIIGEWSPFLPSNVDAAFSLLSESVPSQQPAGATTPPRSSTATPQDLNDDDDDDENLLSGGNLCVYVLVISNTSWWYMPSWLSWLICWLSCSAGLAG